MYRRSPYVCPSVGVLFCIHKSTFLTGYHCLCSLCFFALFIHNIVFVTLFAAGLIPLSNMHCNFLFYVICNNVVYIRRCLYSLKIECSLFCAIRVCALNCIFYFFRWGEKIFQLYYLEFASDITEHNGDVTLKSYIKKNYP